MPTGHWAIARTRVTASDYKSYYESSYEQMPVATSETGIKYK